ncbi:PIF1-like helicase-domain-containing protein [Lactarius akahatsu]|uniref:ATP-dependent DNA helicase n=1 Tax=Lactarius akahatsu TaxID=416441 RepID=A0AAD4QAV7_9AGAM|nr:PIF1-like helicase-domain-containing protein [Lactarius akahatsu]
MPDPCWNWESMLSNTFLQDHLQFDPVEEERMLLHCLLMLNEEQTVAFNRVMDCVLAHHCKTFFLVGVACAGKTFLYNTLCHALRSRTMVALCVAYSGIAAQLLPGGRTAHFTFKILFDLKTGK